MSKQRRFIQCDVFTSVPTKGNALAVVVDGEGLTEEQMRVFAAWTNLAETTFLFPPEDETADYKVRIMTPTREMPFAGHPTLGSCAAWLKVGGKPKTPGIVRQECGVGIIEIDIAKEVPAFTAPPTEIAPLADDIASDFLRKLNIDPKKVVRTALLDNGPVWHAFELQSAADVLAVDSSLVGWPDEKCIGLIGPHQADAECDYEVRMLAPSSGMSEDPITGSLNAALAHWMMSLGLLKKPIVVAQGTCIDRVGRVYIEPQDSGTNQVSIGGHTHILVEGTVLL